MFNWVRSLIGLKRPEKKTHKHAYQSAHEDRGAALGIVLENETDAYIKQKLGAMGLTYPKWPNDLQSIGEAVLNKFVFAHDLPDEPTCGALKKRFDPRLYLETAEVLLDEMGVELNLKDSQVEVTKPDDEGYLITIKLVFHDSNPGQGLKYDSTELYVK